MDELLPLRRKGMGFDQRALLLQLPRLAEEPAESFLYEVLVRLRSLVVEIKIQIEEKGQDPLLPSLQGGFRSAIRTALANNRNE